MNDDRVTRSRGLRILAAAAAAVALLAGAWVVAGNAYAARREAAAERAFEATFGSRAALEAKYAVAASNAEAQRVQELAKAIGTDFSPKLRAPRSVDAGGGFSEKERAAVMDYVTAQLVRSDDSVEAPPPELAAILDKNRGPLLAFEEFLVSSPAPKWAFEPRADVDARLEPNSLGLIRAQRLLVADALSASARGDAAGGARALEASWKLNEGLALRPEIVSQLIAVAVARYEAGALRRVGASADVWTPRLAVMGARARLVDALVLDHPRPTDMAEHYRRLRPEGVGWWAHNFVSLLEEPCARHADASYSEAWRRALADLRDQPAFREKAPDPKPGWSTTSVLMSIAIPNIRNAFERADRLALDAELTGKILRMKDARRARGAWPEPSPEIAASRFPGLSWNYAVGGGGMTIALSGDLPKAASPFVLPTAFSSRAPAP